MQKNIIKKSETIRFADQNNIDIKLADIPTMLPMIPLRNAVVFPGVLLPIFVSHKESIELLEKEAKIGTLVGLFTQRSPQQNKMVEKSFYEVGTLAEIHRIVSMGKEGYQILLHGVYRIKLEKLIQKDTYLRARVSPFVEIMDLDPKVAKKFEILVSDYTNLHPDIPKDLGSFLKGLSDTSILANQIIFFSQKSLKERIRFLKMNKLSRKIDSLIKELMEKNNRLRVEKDIQNKMKEDGNKMYKEFYLRKQLEIINKELGETSDETDELIARLTKKTFPSNIRKAVTKEVKRVKRMQESNAGGTSEVNQIRNWLELVDDLPWRVKKKNEISLSYATKVLDEDHNGLEDVKKRILDFLAVEKQIGKSRANILCLVGPPGVGKTSLASSIARALDKPLVRVALGGVRDEAEIRGHRRTYIGAMPGKILNNMKKVKILNPVFLLDEIDKTASNYHGDPSSALLEVLDPEQNHSFEDHYLAEAYDLSHVLFICTANSVETIPSALLDRLEIIRLSGYAIAEKVSIAKKYLLPRIMKELKLDQKNIAMSDAVIERIVSGYTKEAGVRDLKRKLESLVQKRMRFILEDYEKKHDSAIKGSKNIKAKTSYQNELKKSRFSYALEDIHNILGRERYQQDYKEDLDIPGVAMGLAWTMAGGDILFIEATSYAGQGLLQLSGQLGDVMKESAQTALSFLRTHSKKLKIDPNIFKKTDIHIHVPSGAIPKDGPSAGVTILSALYSLFIKKAIAKNLAMTGEISLRGKILIVGGIKEKVLAAKSAGIKNIFLPEKNKAEFEEIAPHIRKGIKVKYHRDMLTLLANAVSSS